MPLEQHMAHHQVAGGHDNAANHQRKADPEVNEENTNYTLRPGKRFSK